MLLAIDVGNTNIVLGLIEGTEIVHVARLATEQLKTSDQYRMDLHNVLSMYGIAISEIDGVIISSVVPPVQNSLRTAVQKVTGKAPMVVGPGIKTGLNIQMDNPASIGSDLIVAAVAAKKNYPLPVIIIDMGTATTMTVLDAKGTYVGGCLSPGVKISAEALADKTAQLPAISLEAPKRAIAKNTIDAMRSGLMLGSACMLDGMIERFQQELGQKATVIATGGMSRFVTPMCSHEIIYDRDLLLKGLMQLYENNKNEG